jgi:nucleoside phosphorylase
MLVVAAVEEELGDLPGAVVGVGPVVAAASAAAHLARRAPAAVLLIGTAGAYPGGPAIGSVVASARLGLACGVDALGLGYTPRPPPVLAGDPDLLDALDALGPVRCDVLTVSAISTDRELVRRLAEGWAVEHLEAYGVALACREAGVPFAAVLGISNDVGPDAHAQWLAHRDGAQRAARDVAARLLGARGAAT